MLVLTAAVLLIKIALFPVVLGAKTLVRVTSSFTELVMAFILLGIVLMVFTQNTTGLLYLIGVLMVLSVLASMQAKFA